MALQLFKLASEDFPNISATTSQVARAYFRTMSSTVAVASGIAYSLQASTWVDSDGAEVTGFTTGQGLNILSVNAVLQQPGLYAINTGAVVITGPVSGISLTSGTPVTLQTYNANAGVVVSALASSQIAIP